MDPLLLRVYVCENMTLLAEISGSVVLNGLQRAATRDDRNGSTARCRSKKHATLSKAQSSTADLWIWKIKPLHFPKRD